MPVELIPKLEVTLDATEDPAEEPWEFLLNLNQPQPNLLGHPGECWLLLVGLIEGCSKHTEPDMFGTDGVATAHDPEGHQEREQELILLQQRSTDSDVEEVLELLNDHL